MQLPKKDERYCFKISYCEHWTTAKLSIPELIRSIKHYVSELTLPRLLYLISINMPIAWEYEIVFDVHYVDIE